MVCVPILASLGLIVPKTSSRAITSPAGTADTMGVLAEVALTPEGQVLADFGSTSFAGYEEAGIWGADLTPGTYFIALASWSPNGTNAFLTATVDGAFVDLVSGEAASIVVPADGTALDLQVSTDGQQFRLAVPAEADSLYVAYEGDPLSDEILLALRVGEPSNFGEWDILIDGAGAFEDAAASMMIHPSTRNIVDPTFLAVQHVDIEFHGKEAHASSSPDVGINALDAAVQAYTSIAALRQHMLDTDRIHGIITAGGSAANIVPSHTAMSWYIRSLTDERLEELSERVHACFAAAALSTGCTYETRMVGHPYSNIQNDITMVDLFADNSAALGRDMVRTADAPSRSFGSTDMGNVSYVVPSIHPMLDLGASPAVNHQPEFAAFTVTDAGMAMIRDGALAMAWTAIDLAEKDLWSELGATERATL